MTGANDSIQTKIHMKESTKMTKSCIKDGQEIDAEMRHAELNHFFNWWWHSTGSRPPEHDIEDHICEIARESFFEGVRFNGFEFPKPSHTPIDGRGSQLYALFALGVVVGFLFCLISYLLISQ